MAEIPVSVAGITVGQTLVWDGDSLIPADRTAGSAPRTAATIAALGPGAFDGEQALIRVGTYPNVHEEPLAWSLAEERWFGVEKVLVTQGDTWSMSLGNRAQGEMEGWSPIDAPVPYGASFANLTVDADLSAAAFDPATGTGVLTVDDTTSPHSFPFTDNSEGASSNGAYLRIRDCYITHTGKTATTLTGCKVVQGTRATIKAGDRVWQGFPGGWGFSAVPVTFAALLVAAGLGLQERLMGLGNNGCGAANAEKLFDIAPYWFQYDPGDGTALPSIPPTGGLGVSAILNPPAASGGILGSTERTFYLASNDWTDWPLAAPSKHFLMPRIVGRMASAAIVSGECLDTRLAVRWAS